MPKISIITPVYCDTEQKIIWLNEMIQSVISQTESDWELILIDDQSPISLNGLQSTYNDTRLRWLKNAANSGPAMTRNTAVALAESDCILPLDSDDMLADNNVLERMYEVWEQDKSKTIYGNLQIYQVGPGGNFVRGKVVSLVEYDFDYALNLQGVMPVTCMHSVNAHNAAGGWKPVLNYGREDLEYWIATGKAGFCGQKIPYTTLLYRKHEQSRDYKLKFEIKEVETMQRMIKEMHSDVYNGRYPVACCGKGGSASIANDPIVNDPAIMSANAARQEVRVITTLKDRGFNFSESDMEWVAYRGLKQGSAGRIIVPTFNMAIPSDYPNQGYGHVFQIHKRHKQFFADRQRLGYEINQPDPRQTMQEPEPAKEPELPKIIEVPKPELSVIERLDRVGSETRKADVQRVENRKLENIAVVIDENDPRTIEQDFLDEVIIEPNAPQSYSATMFTGYSVADLGLSDNIINMLEPDWTIKELANTQVNYLTRYRGIGEKRAQDIINKARELINSQ